MANASIVQKLPNFDAQSNKVRVTGSEALIRSLIEEGVDVMFGYPGGAIMPAYDAIYDFQDKIRHILVRHEQGASHAAEGYAWATGRVGVCLATSGPGATNLVTGIADAMIDSVPMVCITGQVAKPLLGTDAFQETDVIGITMPITKWNYQVSDAAEIPHVIAKAFYIAASGRPGPVLIDITKDAQINTLEWSYKKVTKLPGFIPTPKLEQESVQNAAELIAECRKPMILAGHGVRLAKAEDALFAFAEKAGIPVAVTLHGLSSFPSGHHLYAGMLGMHGNYAPNVLTNEADLLIAVGMRFDDRVTGKLDLYAKKAKIIHIDIDQAEIDKIIKTDVAICADAKDALEALVQACPKTDFSMWVEQFRKLDAVEHEKIISPGINPTSGQLKMSEVIARVSESSKGDAIVVSDVGQHQMMAARYYKFARRNSWINSGGLGTMGFALPAAMGAKVGAPDREVIVVVGDGGFQMTSQEMATIAQEGLPIKILLLNNNFLGMVRQWQQLFFENRYSFVDLKNPNFVMLSQAYGIPASKVEARENLEAGISAMLSAKGPYLLEVVVEKEQNVFPMVPAGASVSDIRLD